MLPRPTNLLMNRDQQMSAFSPVCPKCGSANTWIESDQRVQKPVLRCTCGLFEYTSMKSLVAAEADFIEGLRKEKQAKELRLRQEAEEAARKQMLLSMLAANSCSWGPCAAQSRENSIYCSRDCSNKNARARHAARRAAEGRRKAG